MKILVINPPPADVHAQRAGGLLHKAVEELGHECIALPGKELPGKLNFFERRKQAQALRDLHPDIIIYCSEKNFLPGPKSILVTDLIYCEENIEHTRDGTEYFLYTGEINEEGQWEKVLQAFSQFKKWQQSGLQLACNGHIQPKFKNIFLEKLEAYKYRQDIIIQQSHQLAAGAFCVISTASFFDERMDILTAFRTGIPVIAHETPVSKKLCGDSALYANFKDAKALSQQMINVYKNEAMYNHLSEKGKLVSSAYSKHRMLEQLSVRIQQAVEQ